MRTDRSVLWVSMVGLLALAGGGAACGPGEPSARGAADAGGGQPREVALTPVQRRTAQRFVEVTGTLFGEEEVTIAAEVPGRIVETLVDLGDSVEHGAVLARIDPTDYELAVEEARAGLLSALARLGLSEMPEGEVDLGSLPVVARADAQLENARARLDRARQLFEREVPLLSTQDFADIQTEHAVAVTNADVERLNARSLVAETRVRASTLRMAEQRLSDTRVLAPPERPLNYLVAARLVSAGEVVAQGQALFRLVASERVKFRGGVPERLASAVRVGAPAQVYVDAFEEPFQALVARVSPAVEIATRTFEVEVQAENPQGRLKPGSFARVRILSATDEDARFVPASAVSEFAGVQRVFSVADGKVLEHRVRVGPAEEGVRELLEPLPEVDAVIDRPRGLTGGMPVTVR